MNNDRFAYMSASTSIDLATHAEPLENFGSAPARDHIHCEYYPHIDGIRALAVLPVLLYHVLAAICPGGFAGVDVFFVISGYLITGGIVRDLSKGRFTIRGFYHRRIRRILPANFALIAGVFLAGCAIYYCVPLTRLGEVSVTGALFSANIFSWRQGTGYFVPEAHTNPLLHLWSLSVEEQFYVFIPLLCALIWKYRRQWLAPVLIAITVTSLIGAVSAVLNDGQSTAFYLLHYRAWELSAGCVLAILSTASENRNVPDERQFEGKERSSSSIPPSSSRSMCLAAIGLFMVLAPYAALSATTPFPGLAAMPSVFGTALLIRYARSNWVGRLLSRNFAVGVGKISYSLYLWHWPVTVFWRYIVYDQLCMWDYVGMILVSFLLAYLSWRFVERPVRESQSWTMGRSFLFAGVGVFLLAFLGAMCVFGRGWPETLHPKANELVAEINIQNTSWVGRRLDDLLRVARWPLRQQMARDDAKWAFDFGLDGQYRIGSPEEPEVLLLGDSHAGSLRHGLDACLKEQNRGGYAISFGSTHMFNPESPRCQEAMAELAKRHSISTVILAQYWSYDGIPQGGYVPSAAMFDRLEEFARKIKGMGRALVVVTDVPVFSRSNAKDELVRIALITPRRMESGWSGRQSESEYEQEQGRFNQRLQEICDRTGATLVPMHLAFKEGDHYSAYEERHGRVVPLYRDGGHLSPKGSIRASQFLLQFLLHADPPIWEPSLRSGVTTKPVIQMDEAEGRPAKSWERLADERVWPCLGARAGEKF